jgi:thymidylate synthase
VYGFQWRHFGAEYVDMHTDYTGQGVDQLAECIDKIKNNPEDRRIILSAWNPADLGKMALPPCHMFCQFYVSLASLSYIAIPFTHVDSPTGRHDEERTLLPNVSTVGRHGSRRSV